MKKFLKSLALVGALGLAGGSVPASAAFEAQFSRSDFLGLASDNNEFLVELSVSGLHSLGIDLSDEILLNAVIGASPVESPFTIELYDDPGTLENYSSDSLGDFFAGLITPSVTAVPGVPNQAQALFFNFSTLDPNDPSRIIELPDSGVLAKFVVRSAAGATPGQWGIVAAVVADNEVEPAAESSLAGMTTTLVAVPEPETYAMFGAGLVMLGLGMIRRRAR